MIEKRHALPVLIRPAWVLPLTSAMLAVGIPIGRVMDGPNRGIMVFLCALAAVLVLPRRFRGLAVACCLLAFGMLLGWFGFHPAVPQAGEYQVDAIVCQDAMADENGHITTRLTDVYLNGQPAKDAYWSCYPSESLGILPGMRVQFKGEVYNPSTAENPGGFDFQAYLYASGMTYGLYGMDELVLSRPNRLAIKGVAAYFRCVFAQHLCTLMGQDAAGFASAVLVGNKALIAQDDLAAYRRLGMAHILSVSGFHVGILMLLLTRAMRGVRFGIACAVKTLALVLYVILTGGYAPVLRASLLVILTFGARAMHRRINRLWLLCAAWCILLVYRPAFLVSASFQLTFAALMGIVVLKQKISLGLQKYHVSEAVAEPVAICLSAQLGVALPLMWWYQSLPVLGVVLNLLLMPLLSLVIAACWCFVPWMVLPGVSLVLGKLLGTVVAGVNAFILSLNRLPAASLWVCRPGALTFLAASLLVFVLLQAVYLPKWQRRTLALICSVVVGISVCPRPHHGTEYIQFSVGNADCAILWDEDELWMIDAGLNAGDPAAWLKQKRLQVDTLVLSHLHKDHVLGVYQLMENGIPIRRVIIPKSSEMVNAQAECLWALEQLADYGAVIQTVDRGDQIALPSGTMQVLWPQTASTRPNQQANPYSLVQRYTLHNTVLITAGDMSGAGERVAAVPCDIFKAAHHGSDDANHEPFLKALSPQVVLLSGADRKRQEIMRQKLDGTPLFATQSGGAIIISLSTDGYTIRRWKGEP